MKNIGNGEEENKNKSSWGDEKKLIALAMETKPEMTELTVETDNSVVVTFSVSKDYVMADGIRVSLLPASAKEIADRLNCVLPTPELVSLIWQNADLKLAPKSMREYRALLDTLLDHDAFISSQIAAAPNKAYRLVAGHKKDIVTPSGRSKPGKVVIYGWHRLDGKPIQPESSVHSDGYKDYSHGLRLVSRKVLVNGVGNDLKDLIERGMFK